MLKNIKFFHKMIALPLVATAGFLLMLLMSWLLETRNESLLRRIEDGYAPALELSRDLEEILADMQRRLQDAVIATDTERLFETEALMYALPLQKRWARSGVTR